LNSLPEVSQKKTNILSDLPIEDGKHLIEEFIQHHT